MRIAITAIIIVIMAVIGAVVFVKRHADVQQRQIKAVLFGLYFWGLVFLQVIIWGLSYYFK